jgi:transposase
LAPNRKLPGFDGYYKGLVNMKCYICSAEYVQQTGSYEFLSENYTKSDNPIKVKKAKRINKYNLGHKKFYRIKDRQRNIVKDFVNLGLNDFLKSNSDLKLLIVENLNFTYTNHKFSKIQRRRLSSWIKGIMKDRNSFKCQQNGVLLEDINAAYLSQTCPLCWYVHKENRHGDLFHCLSCGFEGQADYVSSLNALLRFKDPDIGRFTPYKEVKGILQERFNNRLRLSNQDSRNLSRSFAEAAERRLLSPSESELAKSV